MILVFANESTISITRAHETLVFSDNEFAHSLLTIEIESNHDNLELLGSLLTPEMVGSMKIEVSHKVMRTYNGYQVQNLGQHIEDYKVVTTL